MNLHGANVGLSVAPSGTVWGARGVGPAGVQWRITRSGSHVVGADQSYECADGRYDASEPPKICQASADFATRLSTRYAFSPNA